MTGNDLRPARVSDGVPTPLVILGALCILGLLLGAVYIIGNELGKNNDAIKLSPPAESVARKLETPAEGDSGLNDQREPDSGIGERAPADAAISLGGYLTYGGAAAVFREARTRLFPEKKVMLVSLNFPSDGKRSAPNLAIVMTFKSLEQGCDTENINSIDLSFNLPKLGSVPAQKTGLTLRSESDIRLALNQTTCELAKGGRLNLHLLGQGSDLIQPKGALLAWGVKLSQLIEQP